jgi:hypothetical protein
MKNRKRIGRVLIWLWIGMAVAGYAIAVSVSGAEDFTRLLGFGLAFGGMAGIVATKRFVDKVSPVCENAFSAGNRFNAYLEGKAMSRKFRIRAYELKNGEFVPVAGSVFWDSTSSGRRAISKFCGLYFPSLAMVEVFPIRKGNAVLPSIYHVRSTTGREMFVGYVRLFDHSHENTEQIHRDEVL